MALHLNFFILASVLTLTQVLDEIDQREMDVKVVNIIFSCDMYPGGK